MNPVYNAKLVHDRYNRYLAAIEGVKNPVRILKIGAAWIIVSFGLIEANIVFLNESLGLCTIEFLAMEAA